MKKARFIFSCLVLFTIANSCKKSDFVSVKGTCDFETENIIMVKNKTGTLIYYDANPIEVAHGNGYFIYNSNITEVGKLPIKICNFPQIEFPSMKHGDQVQIKFEGRLVILPETVDAFNTDIQLTGIKLID